MAKLSCSPSPNSELRSPCLIDETLASDPPFSYLLSMQDIIDHENALVEAISDEDRATLLPIIRFAFPSLRKTLQDPSTTLHNSSQHGIMDGLHHVNDMKGMHCRHANDMEGMHHRFANDMEGIPHRYANGMAGIHHTYGNGMAGLHHQSMPLQKVIPMTASGGLQQYLNGYGAQYQKNDKISAVADPGYGRPYVLSNPFGTSHGGYAPPFQEELGNFAICSSVYGGLNIPNSITSSNFTAHESQMSIIPSCIDMDSLHLEEFRGLKFQDDDIENDVDDDDNVDGGDIEDHDDDVDNDDDDVDDDDDDNGGDDEHFLTYHHCNTAMSASDLAWQSSWGNELQHYKVNSANGHFQFPKINRRRRKVIKKAVGWVKKRMSTHPFSLRVRHERKCSLPCCTGCETGVKRRRISGYGPKTLAKNSTVSKLPSSSIAKISKEKTNGSRQSCVAKALHTDSSASNESSAGKEVSHVTGEWVNTPLTTALMIVLSDCGSGGVTACEAMRRLVKQGYSKVIGLESQPQLAAQVKTALRECTSFRELRTRRFILKDRARLKGRKQSMINTLHEQAANAATEEDCVQQQLDSGLSPPRTQEVGCPQDLAQNVQGASSSSQSMRCQEPRELHGLLLPQCRKTDGKQWRCTRDAKLGFLYCERHQQTCRGKTRASRDRSPSKKSYPRAVLLHSSEISADMAIIKVKEEVSETVVDSCSGQSTEEQEYAGEEVEPIRCCRTDGRHWQCSKQAKAGSMYCEHHQSRHRKGTMVVVMKGRKHRDKAITMEKPEQTVLSLSPRVDSSPMKLRARHDEATTSKS